LLEDVRSPRATQAAIQITTPDPELVGRSSSRTASARAILLVLAALASFLAAQEPSRDHAPKRPVAQVNGHQPAEQLEARFNGNIVLYRVAGRGRAALGTGGDTGRRAQRWPAIPLLLPVAGG